MSDSCRDSPKLSSPVTISGGRDPELDAICRTAVALFGVRYAFVSEIDADYQWYIGGNGASVSRVPRAHTFCTNARHDGSHEPLIVLDACCDPRFADLPFVRGAPHIRFYAGVPIVLRGTSICGTVCVADVRSRKRFSTNDERRLLDLALFVEAILNVRPLPRDVRRQDASHTGIDAA